MYRRPLYRANSDCAAHNIVSCTITFSSVVVLNSNFSSTVGERAFYTYIYVAKSDRAAHNTGWRRLVASSKLQIIFHKRAAKYRALLRKMTYKDKGSYESSPPCIMSCTITLSSVVVLYKTPL